MIRRAATVSVALLLLLAGCSSDRDTSESAAPTTTASISFPGESWARVDPVAAGLDPARLDTVQSYLADQKSDCMAIVKDGQIAQDTYWNGTDATTPHEVFSVTKSITSMLVGIAQADGDLTVDEPAS